MRWLPSILLVFVVASCDKPTLKGCEELCRKYSQLQYDANLEKTVATMPPAEAEKARADAKNKWQDMQDDKWHLLGLDNCVTDCRQRASGSEVTCVKVAPSLEAAQRCLSD
jgi:hypothetical protein